MTRRKIQTVAWGALAIVAYLFAAFVLAPRFGPRPLYDGLAPAQSYRYVEPPRDLADSNEPPDPGEGVVDLVRSGSASRSVTTGDGQMLVVFPRGVFKARKGEKAIRVTITPLAPPEPIEVTGGLEIAGNAYRVRAVYSRSKALATPRETMTAVLRYPVAASVMVVREGERWARLKTEISKGSLQLFADTEELGTFAAAGPPHRNSRAWIAYAAAGLGVAAGLAGYLRGRQVGRRPEGRAKQASRKVKRWLSR